MINGAIVLTLLLLSNIILTNGFGALSLQSNKKSFRFIILNSVCMFIVLMSCCSLYGILYTYILDLYNLEKLGLVIIVLFAGIANFGILELIKLLNKEMYYYYDITYSFVVNMAVTIGILFVVNFKQSFGMMISEAALISSGYIIVNVLFACVYARLHNQKISRNARPIPITIITMSIICMIIYAISVSIGV